MKASRQEPRMAALMIAVFIGGMIGASLRAVLAVYVPQGSLHLATFTANIIACFLYAAVATATVQWRRLKTMQSQWGLVASKGMTVGLCGGLSTMSTFAYEIALGLDGDSWLFAVAYLALSLVIGFAAIGLGIIAGNRLTTLAARRKHQRLRGE